MTTRTKKVVKDHISSEEMELAFAGFAKADAQIQKLQAEMDLKMAAIREKYADRLQELTENKDEQFDILLQYANENKDTLFAKRKSAEFTHGTIGFRTGTPKLKTLKKFTWASCLELVKEFMPEYVRTTQEIAKDRLLADRDREEVAGLMPRVGIQVVQDEAFFVEVKKEETEKK